MSSLRALPLTAWRHTPPGARAQLTRAGRWAWLLGVPCLVFGGWTGEVAGLGASALGGALLLWCGLSRGDGQRGPAPVSTPIDGGVLSDSELETSTTGGGMHSMVQGVVDEWLTQMSLSRDQNKEGLENLLMVFSTLSSLMDSMSVRLANFKPSAAPGAVNDAIDVQRPAIDELMAPIERAFAQRQAMLAHVRTCHDTLVQLMNWSKDARELAHHTRMVAFNSSIEAVRGSNGSPEQMAARQAISTEVRRVSESIIAICDALDRLIRPLHEASHSLQQEAVIHDSNEEELRLELELRARHALTALFDALGGSMSSGSELLEASQTISAQMEQAFTAFQFGDRVEQMLQIISQDMQRMSTYARQGEQPNRQDIARWIQELETRYTMDEQRSQHHETELVDRGGRVEFF